MYYYSNFTSKAKIVLKYIPLHTRSKTMAEVKEKIEKK